MRRSNDRSNKHALPPRRDSMKPKQGTLSVFALTATMGFLGTAHAAPTMQNLTAWSSPDCVLTQTRNCIRFADFPIHSSGLLYAHAVYASAGAVPSISHGGPFYGASLSLEPGNDGYVVRGTGWKGNAAKQANGSLLAGLGLTWVGLIGVAASPLRFVHLPRTETGHRKYAREPLPAHPLPSVTTS
jgi:hypothetical protein